MSRLSAFLDRNPAVTKLLATALAVGAIAAGSAGLRSDDADARSPVAYGATMEAGDQVREALAKAAADFAEMGRLLESGLAGASLHEAMLQQAHVAQARLIDVLDRVDSLEKGVSERVRAQRPAVIAWLASSLLVDFETAMESKDYEAAREAVAELQGWIPEIEGTQASFR